MKTRIRFILGSLASVCLLVAAPTAQAVIPPPDGGYPGFNTAEGTKALFSLTTGSANTAVGWFSLFSDTTGSFKPLRAPARYFSIPQREIQPLARRRS